MTVPGGMSTRAKMPLPRPGDSRTSTRRPRVSGGQRAGWCMAIGREGGVGQSQLLFAVKLPPVEDGDDMGVSGAHDVGGVNEDSAGSVRYRY